MARSISHNKRFRVLLRDQFTCQYCGAQAPEMKLHVDHIVPVKHGGGDSMDNLVTACISCNFGKSAKTGVRLNTAITFLNSVSSRIGAGALFSLFWVGFCRGAYCLSEDDLRCADIWVNEFGLPKVLIAMSDLFESPMMRPYGVLSIGQDMADLAFRSLPGACEQIDRVQITKLHRVVHGFAHYSRYRSYWEQLNG